MIKFIGEREGRPMLGLGLSRLNCEKLLDGNPIFIDLKVMAFESRVDLNDATVLIFAGETEEAMLAELEAARIRLPKPKTHNEEN